MDLAKFRKVTHKLLKKYPYIVPEEVLMIVLDRNYLVYMTKNGKYA